MVVAVLVVVALVGVIYVSARGGHLARVEIADGVLIVRPRGLNRLWAMRAEVRVPLSEVADVHSDVPRRSVPSGLRLPGTYVPRLIQAGTYRMRGEKSFWLVGRTPKVTVIECPGARFDRIVLQLSDEEAAEVRRAVTSAR